MKKWLLPVQKEFRRWEGRKLERMRGLECNGTECISFTADK
jgi:hypothetical protein